MKLQNILNEWNEHINFEFVYRFQCSITGCVTSITRDLEDYMNYIFRTYSSNSSGEG